MKPIEEKVGREVKGFAGLYAQIQPKTIISDRNQSTVKNYSRCLAQLALHYKYSSEKLDVVITSKDEPAAYHKKSGIYSVSTAHSIRQHLKYR